MEVTRRVLYATRTIRVHTACAPRATRRLPYYQSFLTMYARSCKMHQPLSDAYLKRQERTRLYDILNLEFGGLWARKVSKSRVPLCPRSHLP